MTLPILILISVLQGLPCEYIIDFGPPCVMPGYEVVLVLVSRDGTALKVPIGFGDVRPCLTKPDLDRDFLAHVLTGNDWVSRPGPGATLIVTGTKKGSAVKSVIVKSEAAVPTVRWVPIATKPPQKPKK